MEEWARDDAEAGFGLATSSLSVTYSPVPSSGYVRLTDKDGRELLRESVDEDAYVQEVWLEDRYLVIQTINTSERSVGVSAYEVDGGTVESVDLTELNAQLPNPPIAFFGTQLAWTTGFPDDGMCIAVTDLSSGQTRRIECQPKGLIVDDIALDRENLVFSVLTNSRSAAKRCKEIKVVSLRGRHDRAAEQAIAAASECRAWSAVPLPSGGVAWDVADPNTADLPIAEGYYFDGATSYELGDVDTDSFVACGGRLFWTDSIREATTPFVWVPGEPTYQRALELPPDQTESATALHCASDRFLTTRIDELTGRGERLRLVRLDAREGL